MVFSHFLKGDTNMGLPNCLLNINGSKIDVEHKRKHLKNDGTPCAVKVACTVWNGGKLGDNFKKLPIIISGGGGSAVATYLLDNWEDKKYRQKHFGIIDKGDKYLMMEAYKFPEAKEVLHLPSAISHKVEMYACLTDMWEQNLIRMPKPLNLRQEFENEYENELGELICEYTKAQPEELRAMTELELLVTELTAMQRTKTPNGNVTIRLAKSVERKLHDDRAYTCALLAYHLYQLRLAEMLAKEKEANGWKNKYDNKNNHHTNRTAVKNPFSVNINKNNIKNIFS